MSDFQGFSIAAFGTNGTGKTTACLGFAKRLYELGVCKVVLILVPDPEEELLEHYPEVKHSQVPGLEEGIFVLVVEDPNETFRVLYNHVPPYTCLFSDDMGATVNPRDPFVLRFMKRRRQKRVHFIGNCHGATDYPRSLFKNTMEFWIFQTTDSTKNISDRVQDRRNFERAVEYVNKIAREGKPHFFLRYKLSDPPRFD